LIITTVLLCVAVGGFAWFSSTAKRGPARSPAIETIYRNARPGVAHVGDQSCAKCHSEIAATYRNHPMGRSITPI